MNLSACSLVLIMLAKEDLLLAERFLEGDAVLLFPSALALAIIAATFFSKLNGIFEIKIFFFK